MGHYTSIIPIELAKELQDVPAKLNYITKTAFETEDYSPKVGDIITDDELDKWNYTEHLIYTISAPSYAEVFDWFMKKDIIIEVRCNISILYTATIILFKGIIASTKKFYRDGPYFNNWQEAADDAIRQALLLIK